MDINMPGMDGIECVKRLKTLAPQIQILMLTVYEDTDKIFQALAAGASGYRPDGGRAGGRPRGTHRADLGQAGPAQPGRRG